MVVVVLGVDVVVVMIRAVVVVVAGVVVAGAVVSRSEYEILWVVVGRAVASSSKGAGLGGRATPG